jgi:uncharacterized membrane protein YGL010W
MGKRTIWIAEIALFTIGVISLFTDNKDISMACVVAIAATLTYLKDDTKNS